MGYGIVTSAYYYDTNKETYQKSRRVNWKKKGVWEERDGTIVLKTLTDITKYPDYVKQLIELIGIESDEVVNNTNNSKMNLSLNTILYGPPGTGKTHILKNQYNGTLHNKKGIHQRSHSELHLVGSNSIDNTRDK